MGKFYLEKDADRIQTFFLWYVNDETAEKKILKYFF